MASVKDVLKSVFPRSNPLKLGSTATKVKGILSQPYIQLPKNVQKLYGASRERLPLADDLLRRRTQAFCKGLLQLGSESLQQFDKQMNRVVLEALTKGNQFYGNPIMPRILDDDDLDRQSDVRRVVEKQLELDTSLPLHGGVLIAAFDDETNLHGYIYQPGDPKERGAIHCLFDSAFTVADESLKYPLHCGDEVEFRIRQRESVCEVYDLKVTKYGHLSNKEIDLYLERFSDRASRPLDVLLSMTNYFPFWKYVLDNLSGNDDQTPPASADLSGEEGQSQVSIGDEVTTDSVPDQRLRAEFGGSSPPRSPSCERQRQIRALCMLKLISKVSSIEAANLQRARVESFLTLTARSKFGQTLLQLLTSESNSRRQNVFQIRDFLLCFVEVVPSKAGLIAALIKQTALSLNKLNCLQESNDFLLRTLEKTLASQVTEEEDVDVQKWNNIPLIITPKELRIASKERHNLTADLPVVRLQQPYSSLEDYFNTYFTLLRYDCYGQLCDVIRSVKLLNMDQHKHNLYKILDVTGIHFLRNGGNMAFCLKFEPFFPLDPSSGALRGENLLCISLNGTFNDKQFVWATIASQRGTKTDRLDKEELYIRFCTEANGETDAAIISRLHESSEAVMVESPAFYRAYQPVLEALQRKAIEEMPFQKSIVYLKPEKGVEYVTEETVVDWSSLWVAQETTLAEKNNQSLTCTVEEIKRKCSEGAFECKLDESQLEAVMSCFDQPITIIQGPPGTGKTFVGVEIMKLLLSVSTRPEGPIVVMTYKNKSLDHFLNFCFDFVNDDEIVRIGKSSHPQLEDRCLSVLLHTQKLIHRGRERRVHYDSICRLRQLKAILNSAGRELKKCRHFSSTVFLHQATEPQIRTFLSSLDSMAIKRALGRKEEDVSLRTFLLNYVVQKESKNVLRCLDDNLKSWLPSQSHFDDVCEKPHDSKEGLFDQIKEKLSAKDKNQDNSTDVRAEYHDQIQEVRKVEVDRTNSFSYHERNVLGRKKIDEGIESIVFEDSHDKSQSLLEEVKRRQLAELTRENQSKLLGEENLSNLDQKDRAKLVQHWLDMRYREASAAFTEAAEEYHAICQQIQDRNKVLYYEILKSAKIVGMTTTGAAIHQDLLLTLQPSVVIVEEACEVLEAQLLATLTPSVKHLIMIGDHMQLRPIVSSHELELYYNFNRSMFERLVTNNHPHVTLLHQRRMRQEFIPLLSPFYPKLQSYSNVDRLKPCPFLPKNLFFWTCRSREHRLRGGIISNPEEAEYVKQIVLFLLCCGESASDITVLTPYRGQVHKILELLQNCAKDCKSDRTVMEAASLVNVSTVDHYQGEENKIIVLSLVRSNKKDTFGFLKEKNRLVVAISRQRSTLIFVGDSRFLKRNNDWKRLIEKLESQKLVGETIPIKYPLGSEEHVQNIDLERALVERATPRKPSSFTLPAAESPSLSSIPSSPASPVSSLGSTSSPEKFPETDKSLKRFARRLGPAWQDLATELGLEQTEIDTIKCDYSDDTAKQGYHALRKWKQKEGPQATREEVIKALKELKRLDLVEVLKDL
eukprot:m.233770 g.233770  ORF g.233770 m.233770 type:complete len:1538 (+) comp40099_c0_seq4:96-4709(+)